ncbi:urease subunit beta [Micrococcales bacterium 31B]|nr:urease subunit beta [Micrococcales bacterium 31B]
MAHASTSGPGAIRLRPEPILINADRERRTLHFTNTADRPIQIGSHVHLADVNSGLQFDRQAAFGCHLDIPAGTSIRFEPGVEKALMIVTFGGFDYVPGISLKSEYNTVAPNAEYPAKEA